MEFISKVNDVLMLDDGISYFVKSQVVINNENYLLLQQVPETVDQLFPETNRKIEFVKEVVDEENEFYLEVVESAKLKKKILDSAKK